MRMPVPVNCGAISLSRYTPAWSSAPGCRDSGAAYVAVEANRHAAAAVTTTKAETPFFLGDGTDISFKVDNGELVLTAFEPAGDQWRVAEAGQFTNLALEANFRTGTKCAGRDNYGMIVRAPSQTDNIINSAYVFGFNCDGQYRVYRMDDGQYNGIQNWTSHPGLLAGPNQRNVMTVIANGEKLQLYANNALVYEFIDATYPRGLFGLMIGSGGTQDFQVAVEQLSLWELP